MKQLLHTQTHPIASLLQLSSQPTLQCNTYACDVVYDHTNVTETVSVVNNITNYIDTYHNQTVFAYFADQNYTVYIPYGQNITTIQYVYVTQNVTELVYVDTNYTNVIVQQVYDSIVYQYSPVNNTNIQIQFVITNNTLVVYVYNTTIQEVESEVITYVTVIQNVTVNITSDVYVYTYNNINVTVNITDVVYDNTTIFNTTYYFEPGPILNYTTSGQYDIVNGINIIGLCSIILVLGLLYWCTRLHQQALEAIDAGDSDDLGGYDPIDKAEPDTPEPSTTSSASSVSTGTRAYVTAYDPAIGTRNTRKIAVPRSRKQTIVRWRNQK
jgi:hypothetical protein